MSTTAKQILSKATMPTHLSSAEIRAGLAADVRRRALFSARTTHAGYLRRLQTILAQVASGQINDATARMHLLSYLDQAGYTPETGFPGDAERGVPPASGLTDLSSMRRMNLILKTNRQMASSVAIAQADTPATLDLYPAWRLERYIGRRVPRLDWWQRWQSAGSATDWQGASQREMVALKRSPIWQALGDGAGGYTDTLGNPFPPFAYGSGLDWSPVDADTAADLGLAPEDNDNTAPPSLSPGESEIARALQRMGPDFSRNLIAELEAI